MVRCMILVGMAHKFGVTILRRSVLEMDALIIGEVTMRCWGVLVLMWKVKRKYNRPCYPIQTTQYVLLKGDIRSFLHCLPLRVRLICSEIFKRTIVCSIV